MAKKRRSRQFKHSSQVININDARAKRRERLEKQREASGYDQTAAEKEGVRKRGRQYKLRRVLVYFGVFCIITGIVISSVVQIVSLKAEQQELEQKHEEMLAEQEALKDELKHLNDPAYIEEQARQQLRLMLPGDEIIIFPESSSKNTEQKNAD